MRIERENAIAGWHFLDEKGRLVQPGKHHGRRRTMKPGTALHVPPPIVMCERGLHMSKKPLDALTYCPTQNPVISRVLVWGEVQEQSDKLVAEYREVVAMCDAAPVLHEFACLCAEDALSLVENPDPRSVAAIDAKRKWLRGGFSNDDLDAARRAAWSAARSAAWSAARSAAWSAARRAAWSAADAADAAWSAAESAAWSAQNLRLETMFREALNLEASDERD